MAYLIDYSLIFLYAISLFGLNLWLSDAGAIELRVNSPLKSQLVGFMSLSLPAFLYLYLSERSKFKATLGKRWMNLQVVSAQDAKENNLFLRNLLKLMPWEIAHTGVYWAYYFLGIDQSPPTWIMGLFILSQVLILVYFISCLLNGGSQSLYDRWANSKVESNS